MKQINSFLLPRVSGLLLLSFFLLCGGAGCTARAKGERYVKRADEYFQKGDLERARIEYLNALRLNKSNPHVLARLGEIYLETGRLNEAYQFLASAKEVQPTNLHVRAKLGTVLLVGGRPQEARAEAETILKSVPLDPAALGLLASSTTNAADLASVRQRIAALSANHPANVDLHITRGLLAQQSDDHPVASNAFTRAVQLAPQNPKAHFALGRLQLNRGNLPAAESSLKAAADLASPKSQEKLAYPELLLRTGRADEAKKALLNTTEKAPDFVPAWNLLSQIALAEKDTNSLATYVAKVLAQDSNNRDALLNRARLKLASGQIPAATSDLQKLSDTFPRDSGLKYQLALAHLAAEDPDKALASLDAAVNLNANNAEAILLRAQLQGRKGNLPRYIPELSRLFNENPKLGQAGYLLAAAHRQGNDPAQALEIYQKIAEANPKDPQPHSSAASIYAQQGNLDKARASYLAALQVNSDFIPAVSALTDLDIFEKRYPDAITRINGYLEKYPEKPILHLLHAKILYAQNKNEETEAVLKKAVALDPDFEPAHRFLADFYTRTGQVDQAIRQLTPILNENNKNAGVAMLLGVLYEQQGEKKKAREMYELVISAQPSSISALNNLAYLLSHQNETLDTALQHAQKAHALAPEAGPIADTLGWIHYRKGNYPEALSLLTEAVERLENNPEVQYHLGMTHYRMGNLSAAASSLKSALNSTNTFSGKEEAAIVLASLNSDRTGNSLPDSVENLQKLVQQNPSDLTAALRLAALLQEKEPQRAAEVYQTALKHHPRSAPLLGSFALLQSVKLENHVKGIELARQAWSIAKSPDLAANLLPVAYNAGDYRFAHTLSLEAQRSASLSPDLLYYSGLSAYALGRLSSAAETLNGAAAALPGDKSTLAKAAAQIAAAHAGSIKTEELQGAVATSRQVQPDFPPAVVGAGLAAEQTSDFRAARQAYETALAKYPGLVIAQRQLAVLLADKFADDATALKLANVVRADFPQDAGLTAALGKLAYRRGDHRDAARLLSLAALSKKDDADLLYYFGMAQYHTQDKAAKTTLSRALALEPDAPLAADAKKALSQLK